MCSNNDAKVKEFGLFDSREDSKYDVIRFVEILGIFAIKGNVFLLKMAPFYKA